MKKTDTAKKAPAKAAAPAKPAAAPAKKAPAMEPNMNLSEKNVLFRESFQ